MRRSALLGLLAIAATMIAITGNSILPRALAEPAPPRPTLPVPIRPTYIPEPPTPTAYIPEPPTPTAYIPEPPVSVARPNLKPDQICLRLLPLVVGDGAVSSGTYAVTLRTLATNNNLRNGWVIIPLPQVAHTVVDVHTSRDDFWVQEITDQHLTLRLPVVQPGEILTATLHIRPQDPLTAPALTTQASAQWTRAGELITTGSNQLSIDQGWQMSTVIEAQLQLAHHPTRQNWELTGNHFNPFEAVGIWATTFRNQYVALQTVRADSNGRWSLIIPQTQLPREALHLVAQGTCSKTTQTVPVP